MWRRRSRRTKRVYCVTKNETARCAGHDTAIRLELRFFSRRCRGGWKRSGPQRRYFESKDGPPRVDKENPVRPVDCRSSFSNGAYATTLARVYAHVNPDSRTSFHKFLPADILPRITARRFTAKPRVGKIVFTASGYA